MDVRGPGRRAWGCGRGGYLYRVEAAFDPVADLGASGGDPTCIDGMDGFHAEEVLEDGEIRNLSIEHESCLTSGSTSQHNTADVIVGPRTGWCTVTCAAGAISPVGLAPRCAE